ncbi:hypothetical protein QE366_000909 [Nocardioides zeae]|nr:hypothetical protein [Nocardioides zeae]
MRHGRDRLGLHGRRSERRRAAHCCPPRGRCRHGTPGGRRQRPGQPSHRPPRHLGPPGPLDRCGRGVPRHRGGRPVARLRARHARGGLRGAVPFRAARLDAGARGRPSRAGRRERGQRHPGEPGGLRRSGAGGTAPARRQRAGGARAERRHLRAVDAAHRSGTPRWAACGRPGRPGRPGGCALAGIRLPAGAQRRVRHRRAGPGPPERRRPGVRADLRRGSVEGVPGRPRRRGAGHGRRGRRSARGGARGRRGRRGTADPGTCVAPAPRW